MVVSPPSTFNSATTNTSGTPVFGLTKSMSRLQGEPFTVVTKVYVTETSP